MGLDPQAAWERYVEQRGPDECWPWVGPTDFEGYGVFRAIGQRFSAHRFAFWLSTGESPPVVRHSCDHRWCQNERHLLGGTQSDNIRDRVERGRSAKGEQINTARLREDDVIEARRRVAEGESIRAVARDLGVHNTTLRAAVRRSTWRHVA